MAINSLLVRKKSRMSAWLPSTYSTKKATEHPRWYSLSATAAEVVAVEGGTRRAVGGVGAPAAAATAAAITGAAAAVASASFLAAAVAAPAAAEAIGAGLTACGPGALTTTATSLWKGQRRLLVLAPRPQALVPLALIGTNF